MKNIHIADIFFFLYSRSESLYNSCWDGNLLQGAFYYQNYFLILTGSTSTTYGPLFSSNIAGNLLHIASNWTKLKKQEKSPQNPVYISKLRFIWNQQTKFGLLTIFINGTKFSEQSMHYSKNFNNSKTRILTWRRRPIIQITKFDAILSDFGLEIDNSLLRTFDSVDLKE